ncbi:MAG: radical SAM protein [Candidatus Cloacimonadaceae bacterium]
MLIYPVFIPQKGCPFHCIYCDQESFGSAQELPLDVLQQQIEQFCLKNHHRQKQIAFYGGTFTALSLQDRERYYQLIEPFMDNKTTLRISTRPDFVSPDELDWCKKHHITTIELGIQDFDDAVLAASGRGYDSKTAVEACLRVKQYGFELGVQIMPGLSYLAPASNQNILKSLETVRPDFLRIYPLIILKGTPLWKLYEAGKIKPLYLEEAINICVIYLEWAKQHKVAVIKLGIPSLEKDLEYAGPYHPAFGELVKGERLLRKIVKLYQPGKVINLSGRDISLLTGHQGYNLSRLKQKLGFEGVKLRVDQTLPQGDITLSDI